MHCLVVESNQTTYDEFFRLSCLEIFFAKLLCSEQFGHSPSIVAH